MKKIKYFLITIFLFLEIFCMPIMASHFQSSSFPLFNQPRIGVGFALEGINGVTHLKSEPTGPGRLGQIQSTQSQAGRKLQISPYIEFGAIIAKNYYLGLQMNWRFVGLTNKSRTPIKGLFYFAHEFKINNYTDIVIKLGYKFAPRAMIYGFFGPSIAKWSHISNEFDGGQNLVDSIKIERKSTGFAFGLGCEYLFREKYAFSFDYTHHFHRSTSKIHYLTYLDANGPPGGTPRSGNILKKVQPSYGTIAIRVTTFFNL